MNETGFENDADFETWVAEREREMFDVDKFNEMGKGDDYLFQALVFAGRGAQQLSLSTTILGGLSEVPNDLKAELKSIQQQLHDFQEKLRKIK